MSNNVTFLNMDDDDDKTIFQTEEELRKIEAEISGLTDDDTTEVDLTETVTAPVTARRTYWQGIFG